MPPTLRHLLQPLNLAGLFTMASVGLTLRWLPADVQPTAMALLLAFALAFLARDAVAARWPALGHVLLVIQPLLALWLVWLTPELGTAQILLVVWTVVAVIEWPIMLRESARIPPSVGVIRSYSAYQSIAGPPSETLSSPG